MLDGLEAADGAAELDTLFRVAHCGVEAALRGAQLFGGERHQGEVAGACQACGGLTVGTDQPRGDAVEAQSRDLAGAVERAQWLAGEPGRGARHGEQRRALRRVGHHQNQVCGVTVEHQVGVAEQPIIRVISLPGDRHCGGIP